MMAKATPTQPSLQDGDGKPILEEIEEIRDAAEDYMGAKAKSEGAKEELKLAKDKMLALMDKHDLENYSRGTVTVSVSTGNTKLKVSPREAAPASA